MREFFHCPMVISILMFGFVFLVSAGDLVDDFEDDDISDWIVLSGAWSAEDGVLHQTQMGGPQVIVWETPGELEDFTISVEAMGLIGDADWGLAFHGSEGGNHYSWQYVNSGLMFVVYTSGARVETNLQAQTEILNEWQAFEVVAEGDSYDLYWEGDMIRNFTHGALTGGRVGLFAWDVADFDDFTVSSSSIAGLAVSPVGSLTTAWGSIKVK